MHHALQIILIRISGALVVCAHAARYFLSRKPVVGVRIIVTNITAGESGVLLVRPLYAPHVWTLPGGGVEHGEDVHAAAVRELHEETGLVAEVATLLPIATHEGMFGAKDIVHVFVAPHTTGEVFAHADWEILERKFFTIGTLPPSLLENHRHYIQKALQLH
jgi:ADP-ribose pyrophosphatase YjhB (NUDIX family)